MKCKNDKFIYEFLKDKRYRICYDGTILTSYPEKGHPSKVVPWRVKYVKQDPHGYRNLRYKGKWLRVSRIIFAAFSGDRLKADREINHIDGDPKNNSIYNLELVTIGDNLRHSYDFLDRKSSTARRRFSKYVVNNIRKNKRKGMSLKKLAEIYGTSKSTISYIVNFKTYRDIK